METDRLDRWIPRLMVIVVLAVATFAFTESYTHIYYLAQAHHETGAALRMLPLSVDLVMVGAGLVMLHLKRKDMKHPLPRAALYGGAGATLAANVGYGIFYGWLAALISAWAPVALFVAVELGMLLVRTAKAKPTEANPFEGMMEALSGSRYRSDVETQLRQPSQPAPDPSPDTATFPQAVTDSPQKPLAGWGQLTGSSEPADRLTGIGLKNGRR